MVRGEFKEVIQREDTFIWAWSIIRNMIMSEIGGKGDMIKPTF